MNHFVIADNRKCVGCFACVAACVESHRQAGLQAYPRLFVTFTPQGVMPIQCRHCEDAMCVLVCPVNAITYTDHSVQINESLCIGCKMCAIACPYGNILPGGSPALQSSLNAANYTYVNHPYQPDPMVLRYLSYAERLSLLNWKAGQKTVAVKCDLCYFRPEGPACVQACPHQALRLVTEQPAGRKGERIAQMKQVAQWER